MGGLGQLLTQLLRWALIGLIALQFWFFGHIVYWNFFNPQSTAFMRARLAVIHQKKPKAQLRQQWVSYPRISVHLKRALVAAEDAKFVDHPGFDWDGIRSAYERNRRAGAVVAGGSTISQQLAKNLFFSGERTWWRKSQEAVVTVMLETVMSKRRIFEIYLNVIEWGDGVFGAEAAARYHYGTNAQGLDHDQAARLAAVVPSPRRYGPASNSLYLQRRSAIIGARMDMVRIP